MVIGDISPEAEETGEAIREGGGKAVFVETNVVDSASVKNLIETAVGEFGKIDRLQ